jgi:UDP-N-acetylmuramoyl-tripeptide--D-alanyl-D-alanine ligase
VIPWTLAEVAAATGGRLSPEADPAAVITGPVVADSRAVRSGALFVALPGERVDGHRFAGAAVDAGAAAVLAGREVGVPAVLVDDPLAALGRLARAVVDRLPDLTVVAVTGSSGKTGTKDLLAALLVDLGPTVAPTGSFNNELGLPLTALRCDHDTRFLVAEMGARGPGDLTYLCGITPPRIAVVLNVGTAHVGVFGSRSAIAAAKGELPSALTGGGVAVLNADDALVRAMPVGGGADVVLFGTADDAQVRAEDVTVDDAARARFMLVTPQGRARVTLRLHGAFQVSNALAAAAVAVRAGLPLDRTAALLSAAGPASRWRMEVTTRPDGVTLVNDAYNANPDSMRAALHTLAAMAGARSGGRSWAVLGEMLELGEASRAEHEAIGRLAVGLGVDHLVVIGAGAEPIMAGARSDSRPDDSASHDAVVGVPDPDVAYELLADRLRGPDLVLIKASRAVGLDRLARRLLDDTTRDGVPVSVGATPAGEDGDLPGGRAVPGGRVAGSRGEEGRT